MIGAWPADTYSHLNMQWFLNSYIFFSFPHSLCLKVMPWLSCHPEDDTITEQIRKGHPTHFPPPKKTLSFYSQKWDNVLKELRSLKKHLLSKELKEFLCWKNLVNCKLYSMTFWVTVIVLTVKNWFNSLQLYWKSVDSMGQGLCPIGPFITANRTIADLRYRGKDIISPSTLIFAPKKS